MCGSFHEVRKSIKAAVSAFQEETISTVPAGVNVDAADIIGDLTTCVPWAY